jgi:hypothetical protein
MFPDPAIDIANSSFPDPDSLKKDQAFIRSTDPDPSQVFFFLINKSLHNFQPEHFRVNIPVLEHKTSFSFLWPQLLS